MTSQTVLERKLSRNEVVTLERVIAELDKLGWDPGQPELHDQIWKYVSRLPEDLREFLETFRREEPAAALKISGLPINNNDIGPTPANWQAAADSSRTRREEFFWRSSANA